jgi:hypothetical protein
MECTNLVDPHQLLCPWFAVVFVLFCIYTPRQSVPKTDCQPRRRSILDFSEIRELFRPCYANPALYQMDVSALSYIYAANPALYQIYIIKK